jgi:hypothetical protein
MAKIVTTTIQVKFQKLIHDIDDINFDVSDDLIADVQNVVQELVPDFVVEVGRL